MCVFAGRQRWPRTLVAPRRVSRVCAVPGVQRDLQQRAHVQRAQPPPYHVFLLLPSFPLLLCPALLLPTHAHTHSKGSLVSDMGPGALWRLLVVWQQV
jgi:hypothetical protein